MSRRSRCLAVLFATAAAPGLGPGPALAALPEVPDRFTVVGEGQVEVRGAVVPIRRFQGELVVRSDGTATLARLSAEPRGGVFHVSWFLGGTDVPVMCPEAASFGAIGGRVDASGNLVFWPGARIVTTYWEEGGPFVNGCPGAGGWSRVTATTDRPLTGFHDPVGDVFRLDGLFHATVEGEGVDIRVTLAGRYENRPPRAAIGIAGEGIPDWRVQGGCPVLTGVNPPSAEANGPDGLRLTLLSASSDPDGSLARSDLALEQWFHWRGVDPGSAGSTSTFLGRGRRVGPVLFEFGPPHTVVLSSRDFTGAEDRARCAFYVDDSTPPVVTPPPPLRIPCAGIRGVTPGEHPPLARWLEEGTASDLVDPAPVRLTAQVAGADVTDSTLFPIGTTTVAFRFYDRFYNVGQATSTVTVTARLLSDLTFDFDRPFLPGTGRWIRVLPRFAFRDLCGVPIRLRLLAVKSNGPEDIETLVRPSQGAKGEPALELLAVPLEAGKGPRVYTVTYLATDADGNQRELTSELRVEPPQGE